MLRYLIYINVLDFKTNKGCISEICNILLQSSYF